LTADFENCDVEFETIIYEFVNSKLEEFRAFGRLLKRWKPYIKNSFIRINGKRLSNGPIEGVVSRIKTIMKNANGYVNFGRLRNRIMYSLNNNMPIQGMPRKKV
jgi:transposase